MMLTRKAISRRTVLRGLGTTVALPLLDAMVPALTALQKTPAAPVRRLGVVYHPNGVIYENWLPKGTGRDFTLSPILEPLEPFRKQLVVVTGLSSHQAEALGDGGGDHSRASGIVSHRRARQEVGQRRRQRHVDGPDRRQGARARDAAVVAAADRGRQQPGGRLRRRLQLRLQQHAVVADADAAADGGEQPAGGLRAPVRREREHRPARARVAPAPRPQHPRLGDGTREASCSRPSARPTTAR